MAGISKAALCLGAAFSLTAGTDAYAADPQPEQVGEIIVTARRTEEKLQDVPISISVFNQAQLNDRNIVNLSDLARVTPSLATNNLFGSENTTFSLRGFAQSVGSAPTVGVLFAETVAPRGGISGSVTSAGDGAGPGSFFDLQNVQVLKGPQGTLFGINTTGGDVLLVPQKPKDKFEAYIESSFGNYNMRQLQAVINIPISDQVRLRAGLDWKSRDGYLHSISGIGPKDFDNINYVAGRVSLVIAPSDNIENYSIATFAQSDTNGTNEKIVGCTPDGTGFIAILGPMACDQMARDRGKYTIENDLPGAQSWLQQWQVINTTTWHASDTLTIKNIASYAQLRNRNNSSLFGVNFTVPDALPANFLGIPVPVPVSTGALAGQHYYFTALGNLPGQYGSEQETHSEELQVHGVSLDGRLDWQVGAFYEGSHSLADNGMSSPQFLSCTDVAAGQCTDPIQQAYEGIGIPNVLIGSTHNAVGRITFRDYAFYGQATYKILDQLKITAGIRWTDDSTKIGITQINYYFPAPNTPLAACSSDTLSLSDNCMVRLKTSSHAPTWVLGLDWHASQYTLLYAKYSRGYRQGGVSAGGPIDNVIGTKFLTYKPEYVDAYEVGTKNVLRGAIPGSINAAFFYNNLTNQQSQVGFTPPFGGASTASAILNVGKSRIWGAELDVVLKPLKEVTITADYTYLNTKITSAPQPDVPVSSAYYGGIQGPVVGSERTFSPRNKLSVGVTYQVPIAQDKGQLSVGAMFIYSGSMITIPDDPEGIVGGYKLVNFNVNWNNVASQPVDLSFFVTNAFNEYYYTFKEPFERTLGWVDANIGEPRMFGGRLKYHF